jgi:hypothetical protein
MWTMIVALGIWTAPVPAAPPLLPQAPYVACIDGHVAKSLADCPTPRKAPTVAPPYGGGRSGGGGGGGLLGGLLGGIL